MAHRRPASRPAAHAVLTAAAAVLLALALSGCGAGNPHRVGTYERGAFFADRGKDVEAVTAFEAFVRRSPTDSLAALAQYRKAQSYMNLREFPLAAVEFQILRKDYPTSELIEDAMFQEGVAYFAQVGRVERDITGAYEARLHFLKFSQEYPGSERMPEVVEYMQEISDLMVRKRLAQVKVYRQLGRHEAVAITLDELIKDEAASRLLPEVLWQRARNANRLVDPETEEAMYRRLVDEYPDSPEAGRARRRLADGPIAPWEEDDS